VSDEDKRAATALFFSELQKSAKLTWYKLISQRRSTKPKIWNQMKSDFEKEWHIRKLFKFSNNTLILM
jgi:hypothetical protein